METERTQSVSLPDSDTSYQLKVVDYGQGSKELRVHPEQDKTGEKFVITSEELYECEWRDTEAPPTDIVRAVELAGYHIKNIESEPVHGVFENVKYLREALERAQSDIADTNVVSQAGLNWATESLSALEKLVLLDAHLTENQYQEVMFKAQETSRNHPAGNLTVGTTNGPTEVSLPSFATTMVAFAQHEGYLGVEIVSPDTVERLVEGVKP